MVARGTFRWASVSLIVVASCSPATRSTDSPSQSALVSEPVEVPLLPYFRGLRTVHITSGTDTLTFLLDTGGGHTLLTVEAAQALGCTPFGRSVGYRMSGERVEFEWCTDIPLAVEGVLLEHPTLAVFDLMALLPPVLPKLDGVLSLESFADRIVTVDLPGERLIIESEASALAQRSAMQPLVARTATGEGGSTLAVFLAARAEGAPVWLLLDNGNISGTILSPHAVAQVGLTLPTVHGTDDAVMLEDGEIEVLGMQPRREQVQVRELIHDGVLGESFMRQGAFMFDFRATHPWVGFKSGVEDRDASDAATP